MDDDQDHFNVLREIQKKPSSSQRELARGLGFSLGKLNYCLKALQNKGLVKIKNFQKRSNKIIAATEDDWSEEYLAPILSIRFVSSLDEAISHIEQYGSAHTDTIVTENKTKARKFLAEVDSSSVMVNASTGFADGFEYGLGAEIGISTDKFHVRGPVGLEGLTSQKYIVLGDGHTRP